MVEQRGLATSPVSSGGTSARENVSELGNAASPVLDSGRRRGGTAGRARRSAAELAVDEGGRNVALWRGEWRV